MLQSYLFLTQTTLNQANLHALVCAHFFQPEVAHFNFFDGKQGTFTQNQITQAQKTLTHFQQQNQVLIPDLSAKKEFREYSLNVYQSFPQPTLLFLGNITDYSIQVQEGMLKLLEEPPHNLTIILYAQNRSDILPTIASRVKIQTISEEIIRFLLDDDLIEKVKKKFPSPSNIATQLVQSPHSLLFDEIFKNISKAERFELDFWLWQIAYYLIEMYKKQPHDTIAAALTRINLARKFNKRNVQKKFAVLEGFIQ